MIPDKPCKGFWNMCSCERCREADRRLERAPEEVKVAARKEAVEYLTKRAARA